MLNFLTLTTPQAPSEDALNPAKASADSQSTEETFENLLTLLSADEEELQLASHEITGEQTVPSLESAQAVAVIHATQAPETEIHIEYALAADGKIAERPLPNAEEAPLTPATNAPKEATSLIAPPGNMVPTLSINDSKVPVEEVTAHAAEKIISAETKQPARAPEAAELEAPAAKHLVPEAPLASSSAHRPANAPSAPASSLMSTEAQAPTAVESALELGGSQFATAQNTEGQSPAAALDTTLPNSAALVPSLSQNDSPDTLNLHATETSASAETSSPTVQAPLATGATTSSLFAENASGQNGSGSSDTSATKVHARAATVPNSAVALHSVEIHSGATESLQTAQIEDAPPAPKVSHAITPLDTLGSQGFTPQTLTTQSAAAPTASTIGQSTFSTSAPAPTAAPLPAMPPQAVMGVITERLTREPDNAERITVQLDPPELGRVAIDFKFDANGLQAVTITGETPDALKQLRLMHFELVQALEKNGIAGSDLNFAEHTFQQSQQDQPNFIGSQFEDAAIDPDFSEPQSLRPVNYAKTNSGLDLKL